MLRKPPHILVTTPESLYLLLTAERSRDMLKTARVVIVDEIHAVLESRRGAHLALSLERLDHACGRRLQRIGLSATQKPIEEVAPFPRRLACLPLAPTLSPCTERGSVVVAEHGGTSSCGDRATLHHRRSRSQAPDGSRDRSAGLAAGSGHVHRSLAGDLPAPRRTGSSASHDADHGEYAPARRAHGASPHRAARRRARRGTSRQPVERKAARRRGASAERAVEGARLHGIARARHRHRSCRSRVPDLVSEPHRDAASACRAFGTYGARPAERARLSADARRSGRVRGDGACREATASSTASACRTSRST